MSYGGAIFKAMRIISDKAAVQSLALMDTASMPEPWYVTTYLLISHLPLLACILINYKVRDKTVHGGIIQNMLISILCISVLYHTCQTTDYCLFKAPVYTWQTIDNIYAFGGFIIILICISSLPVTYELNKRSSIFWGQFLYLSVFTFNLIIVVTSILGPNQGVGTNKSLLILLFAILLLFIKIMYVDDCQVLVVLKFSDAAVFVGFALVLVGVVFFLIEIAGYEWIFHGIWHYCVFTGLALIQYGTMWHLPDLVIVSVKETTVSGKGRSTVTTTKLKA